jgi:protein regulator of cytokinesis 1
MSRVVGDNFFPEDVLDQSVGRSPCTLYQDVNPERFSKLEKELVRGKGEIVGYARFLAPHSTDIRQSKRLNQLSVIFIQIDWLHTELGIVPPTLEDLPSSSSSTSNSLGVPLASRPSSAMGFGMTSPYDVFAPTPTPASRLKPPSLLPVSNPTENEIIYQRIFARFVAQLDEADEEHLAGRGAGLEGVEPTPGLVAWAEATRGTLEDLQRRREAHIQAMYDQLEGLWRRLGVPDTAMDGFVDAHRGSTEETVREYESELERMLELKRERMSTFVENARGEIAKLWDELLIGDDERADFTPYFDGALPLVLYEKNLCDFASQMNTPKNSYSSTKRRSGGSRKSDGQKPIFFRASASISTSAERRRNLQIQRRIRAASLGEVRETQVGSCEKKRCASAFIKRSRGCVFFY